MRITHQAAPPLFASAGKTLAMGPVVTSKPSYDTITFGQNSARERALDQIRQEQLATPVTAPDGDTCLLSDIFRYQLALAQMMQQDPSFQVPKAPIHWEAFQHALGALQSDLELLTWDRNAANTKQNGHYSHHACNIPSKDGLAFAERHGYMPEDPKAFIEQFPEAIQHRRQEALRTWAVENWTKDLGSYLTLQTVFSVLEGLERRYVDDYQTDKERNQLEQIKIWTESLDDYNRNRAKVPNLFKSVWDKRNPHPFAGFEGRCLTREDIIAYLNEGEGYSSLRPLQQDKVVQHPYFLRPQQALVENALKMLAEKGFITLHTDRFTAPEGGTSISIHEDIPFVQLTPLAKACIADGTLTVDPEIIDEVHHPASSGS